MQPRFNDEPLTPTAFLRRAADVFSDRVGVVQGDRQFTYGAFFDRALKFAGALRGARRQSRRPASLCLPAIRT
jgi:fatty-acyl-CoA synthase